MQTFFAAAIIALGALPNLVTAVYDIEKIDIRTRQGWCNAQTNQCPALCALNDTNAVTNECFADNLYWSCVCSDGARPDLKEVSETIPFYLCTLDGEDCVANCGNGNNACFAQCREQFRCGATNPTAPNVTETSTISPGASQTSSKAPPSSTEIKLDENGFAIVNPEVEDEEELDDDSAAGAVIIPFTVGLLAAGLTIGAAVVGL